jgi:hypothetical protein
MVPEHPGEWLRTVRRDRRHAGLSLEEAVTRITEQSERQVVQLEELRRAIGPFGSIRTTN